MSQTDAAAHAFRKKASPVTEENMKPDMELVTAMNKAGIRVQDLVATLSECECNFEVCPESLYRAHKFCKDYGAYFSIPESDRSETILEGPNHG